MKLFCASIFLFFSIWSSAQFPYTISTFTSPYTELQDASVITSAVNWDDFSVPATVPFSFEFFGLPINQFAVADPGCLLLGFVNDSTAYTFSPLFADVRNASGEELVSQVANATDGAPGNQIFKVEWKNAGLYYDTLGNDRINMQLWIYESDMSIEFRYGVCSIADSASYGTFNGPAGIAFEGLNINNGSALNLWVINGNPSSPQVDNLLSLADIATFQNFFNTIPENNLVIRFSPLVTSTQEQIAFAPFSVYPTLAKDHLMIANPGGSASFVVCDLSGKQVLSGLLREGMNRLNIEHVESGIYFVKRNEFPGAIKFVVEK
jgi:hypothetical protein